MNEAKLGHAPRLVAMNKAGPAQHWTTFTIHFQVAASADRLTKFDF